MSSSLTVVPLFLINIYLNSSQTALKYFKNTEANINNVLVMTEDFNIRDNRISPNTQNYSAMRNVKENQESKLGKYKASR